MSLEDLLTGLAINIRTNFTYYGYMFLTFLMLYFFFPCEFGKKKF